VAPFAPIITLNGVSFADPYGSAGVANPFPADFGPQVPPSNTAFPLPATLAYFFSRDFKMPEITIWNLTLERQLGSSWLIKAAYFGNKATHLFGTSDQEPMADINAGHYVPGNSSENNLQQRRTYPNFGPIGMIDSGFNSNYNSGQLSLERKASHGLSLLADYTWSRGLNDFSETVNSSYYQTNPFNRNFNYGPGTPDLTNVIKFSGVWEITHFHLSGAADKFLNGWRLSPIVSWRSGFPFTVMSGYDNSFSGDFVDRADFIGTNFSQAKLDTNRSHNALTQEYFNTAVFGPNALGTFGNSGKNNLRGPGSFDTDIALLKDLKIHESYVLQIRAEAYNAFNDVSFGAPDATLTDPTFGQILSTSNSPRVLQFALKLLF
jgi:hypothetical protein